MTEKRLLQKFSEILLSSKETTYRFVILPESFTKKQEMANLPHRARKAHRYGKPTGQRPKALKNATGQPSINREMSVQVLRDLNPVQGEREISFAKASIAEAEEMYGTRFTRETVLAVTAQASIQNADDIIHLHARIVDLESRVKKQEQKNRSQTVVPLQLATGDFIQMSDIATIEVLDSVTNEKH